MDNSNPRIWFWLKLKNLEELENYSSLSSKEQIILR